MAQVQRAVHPGQLGKSGRGPPQVLSAPSQSGAVDESSQHTADLVLPDDAAKDSHLVFRKLPDRADCRFVQNADVH